MQVNGRINFSKNYAVGVFFAGAFFFGADASTGVSSFDLILVCAAVSFNFASSIQLMRVSCATSANVDPFSFALSRISDFS